MTNTTQHTPGPWCRNIRANGKYPVIFAGRNQYVAQATQQKDGAETEANIDLIAAAPELLEALENLVNWHETKSPDAALKDQLIKDAWAVVDKARGQA